jgi:shikimate dehydrogenase
MKICAAIGSTAELKNTEGAQFAEIRMDVFDKVPDILNLPLVVKITDREQLTHLPKGFNGYVDIGEMKRIDEKLKTIYSIHDMKRTPSPSFIVESLNNANCDIAKGAFMINRMSDLMVLYAASKLVTKKHILIGMGPLGIPTRIRSKMLGNEFTFAHTGTATAPGQLEIKELAAVGDDGIIVGLIGHPLNHSSSKTLHTQAFKDAGIPGIYLNFDLTTLDNIEDVMKAYNIRGLNVTMPYKSDIMKHLDMNDEIAGEVGAVNTIVNDHGKLIGKNTDVDGIEFAFKQAKIELKDKSVLIMGSGGSAKACAAVFKRAGSRIFVVGRNAKTVDEMCSKFDCRAVQSPDPSTFDLIANCTPIGMYSNSIYPIDLSKLTSKQTIFDLTYGNMTPLSKAAMDHQCTSVSGLDMLIGQAMSSFELWTGQRPDYTSLRSALR